MCINTCMAFLPFFTFSHDMFNKDLYEGTRGHSLKLFKDRSKQELRRHFFSQSLIFGIHFRTPSSLHRQ